MYFIATTKKYIQRKNDRVKKQKRNHDKCPKFSGIYKNTLSKKGQSVHFFKCTWTFTKTDHILDH